MRIKITVTVPNGEPLTTHAEVTQIGDAANAIREALDSAREQNPNCSIFDSNIKLESSGDA